MTSPKKNNKIIKKPNISSLKRQAKEILEIAQQGGVEENFFFATTFMRYQMQIGILMDLEEAISESDTLITKEYVKGRGNVYTHPAITEYNKTATAANQTVLTLVKIIKGLREDDGAKDNPLLDFLAKRSK